MQAQQPISRPVSRADEQATEFGSALTVVIINVAVLFCFLLPFATVSCGSEQTRPMTGVQLLAQREPSYELGPEADPGDRQDIRESVETLWRVSQLQFALTALGVIFGFFALGASLRPAEQDPTAATAGQRISFLLPGSFLVVFSFAAGILAGSRALGPDVHHLSGFWLAATLSGVGIVPAFIHGLAVATTPEPGEVATKVCIAAAIAPLALFPMFFVLRGAPDALIMLAFVVQGLTCAFALLVGMYELLAYRPGFAALAATALGGIPLALFVGGLM